MGRKTEKVNKNKSETSVLSCKGCLCHLSSFVFLLPSRSCPSSHLSGYCHSQSAKSLANTAGLPGISASIILCLCHRQMSCRCGPPSTTQAISKNLPPEIDTYSLEMWIDKSTKISFICSEVLLNVT